jgi:hypothetical protein
MSQVQYIARAMLTVCDNYYLPLEPFAFRCVVREVLMSENEGGKGCSSTAFIRAILRMLCVELYSRFAELRPVLMSLTTLSIPGAAV